MDGKVIIYAIFFLLVMAGVTGVLLGQVDEHPAQVGPLGPFGDRERAVEATVGESLVDRGLRSCDGLEPQRPQL